MKAVLYKLVEYKYWSHNILLPLVWSSCQHMLSWWKMFLRHLIKKIDSRAYIIMFVVYNNYKQTLYNF